MAKAKIKAEQKIEMKTYILEIGQQRRLKKVTVPSNWKLTYGFAVPGSNQVGNSNPLVVRFYEGNKENLRALFDDVRSIRDSSIKIEEQIIKTKEETFFRETPTGRKAVQAEARVREWRNPDDPAAAAEEDQGFLRQLKADNDVEVD